MAQSLRHDDKNICVLFYIGFWLSAALEDESIEPYFRALCKTYFQTNYRNETPLYNQLLINLLAPHMYYHYHDPKVCDAYAQACGMMYNQAEQYIHDIMGIDQLPFIEIIDENRRDCCVRNTL